MRHRFIGAVAVATATLCIQTFAWAGEQPGEIAALTTRSCTPIEVGDFQNRIHVRCSTAVNSISFYALATSDSSRTARVLAILSGAWLGGHALTIWYDANDLSSSAIGCNNSDCRLLSWVTAQ